MSANLADVFGKQGFVAANVEVVEANGFTAIPSDDYTVQITDSEIVKNKSNTGSNLKLKLVVQGGKYNGCIIYDILCIQHQNQQAENIAKTKLKRVSDALGIATLSDTSQLHDQNVIASIVREIDNYATEKENQYVTKPEDRVVIYRNNVKTYKPSSIKGVSANNASFNDDIPF